MPATVAQGATRQPIRDCGDVSTLDEGGFFIGAITAQGGVCTQRARGRLRRSRGPRAARSRGSCRVRTYTCLLAKAGKSLTLVRCENARQTTFIRFEFGS